jgi:UDP-N-acetylglucosamine--N-acetylmuramyl-(pentapeptide) pyrophosphoryl-undecaprenol N-acetylglucosamine transferase
MNILLTGGGTAGHVIPNLAIADAISAFNAHARFHYIGSYKGIEKLLAEKAEIPYTGISTGKFRRYFDVQNFIDLFRIPLGIAQAFFALGRIKPSVIFSKGGYVALPVVFAGWFRRIPIVIHDSDSIPGLATRLSAPFAKKIILAFESARADLCRYDKKTEVLGNPVRLSLFDGNKEQGLSLTGFDGSRPILLAMGGSTGAKQINDMVRKEKENLSTVFDVVLLSGEGKGSAKKEAHYCEFPYVEEGMKDIYAACSLAVTRAGAGATSELNALQIPALFYPLGRTQSHGDQLSNARMMAEESSLFAVADEKAPLLPQLMALPDRPQKTVNDGATQKIALTILSAV